MTKIENQLEKIKREKRIGLMTHIVIGYPSLDVTIPMVKTMEKAGADFIELQIPFSDPIADGPTIMKACDDSLKSGTNVTDCFSVMETLAKKVSIPLLFMGYYNTLFSYGVEKFIKKAKKAGCSGLIIPDIPPEEEKTEKFIDYCSKYDIHHIRVVSPASTEERIKKNAKIANGFVYCISRFGTTGSQSTLDPRLQSYLRRAKKHIKLPLAVGFGISKRKHIKALKGYAEIAVVGSAIINLIEKCSQKDYLQRVSKFISKLKVK